jgi:Fic family protein
MEARGKQNLWIGQKPEVLEVLREQAIIQSAESSNRIEGIVVAANRLRPLVIGRAKPRDRSEEELAGYRAALDWTFSRKNRVAITPDVIRRLHAFAQGGASGDAGEWKRRDNEIVEIPPSGKPPSLRPSFGQRRRPGGATACRDETGWPDSVGGPRPRRTVGDSR